MLVLGPVELGVLSGKEDLPSGYASFLGYLEMHLFLACPRTSPAYATGSFDSYVDTSRDYATWFAKSSIGPISGDVPVSKGRVLGGIVRAQVASRVGWRLRVEAFQARVTKLETAVTAREVHMQEETAQALAQERELWQRDRETPATATEREQS